MTASTHISTSGGLISAAFVENARELGTRQRGFQPESFALPWSPAPKSPAALEGDIAAAWELLLERWDAVHRDLPMLDVSQVRSRWLLPLFQVLDFEPVYLRGDTVLDEAGKLRYPLSHRGWEGENAPILHTVIPSQDLDGRLAAGRGIKGKSPHDVLQAFLNTSRDNLWAVLSNGVLLRLLRDYHHTFTKGYVQFDLENIFETRNYGDFRALYRMCHASRFISPQTSEVSETSEVTLPLEQFYQDSIATGVKVGEDLRGQVRQAIETLGNGFLDGELIRRLQGDEALCRTYYGQILHIIYRILFLLFAEQRGMMPGRDSLYAEAYAIARLRARAEGDIPREDDFTDLWEGLKVTFRMVREGVPELGVFGYDGMLFDDDQTPLLSASPPPSQGGGPGRGVRNSDLLQAIRALTLIEREGVLQRISYADLGVEELGSIYESLLDFTPSVSTIPEEVNGRQIPANTFFLDPRGSERKTTGSYYTHPSLVNELIKSALLPVARDRLAAAGLPVIEEEAIGEAPAGLLTDYAYLTDEQRRAGETALLSIKVCDPAAGSGHFLVKANNALGAELARIRTGDEYPSEAQVQDAKREVLSHCIYAVDLNPMAVELCKVSLWINASVADRPLSFLDHHIKCGNSLLGVTPELMAGGIPFEAFDPGITGNDRTMANGIRKRNRQEQEGQLPLGWQVTVLETPEDLARWRSLSQLAEEQPQAARKQYAEYLSAAEYQRRKLQADFWTAAFFWPLPKQKPGFSEKPGFFPTHGEFLRLCAEGQQALPPEALAQVETLADEDGYNFFHWHLEFPDVFQTSEVSETSEVSGGFDVVLGNPPWETLEFKEQEFFADRAPVIANARNRAERRRAITELAKTDHVLYGSYMAATRASECVNGFLRTSGRYPLTTQGKLNTYAVFAGLSRQIIAPNGRAGIIVPLGIASDYGNREFFADVVGSGQLLSFHDFENRKGIFPGVHRNYNFALTTLTGTAHPQPKTEFAFFMTQINHLQEDERRFTLTKQDLTLINPNTRTCPIFNTRRDADLTRKIHRVCPVLHNEQTGVNPWVVSFRQGLFNMATDSGLFRIRERLEAEGYALDGNRFVHDDEVYLPLYEAKMMHQFEHRHGTYDGQSAEEVRKGYCRELSTDEYTDPYVWAQPRYWVEGNEVEKRASEHAGSRRWLIGFRDVTRAVDRRTAQFAVLPLVGIGHKIPIIFLTSATARQACGFLGNINSFPLDYVARQKIGGISLSYFIIRQLPVVPPDRYTPELLDFIVPRVVELTYTAWDLQPFAQDVLDEVGPETWARWFADTPVHSSPPPAWAPGPSPPPFVWDEERRARLRAELDGLYGHLYGLTGDELAYILDTFPIVRRKDEAKYGEYRTKRMVLEQYDTLKEQTAEGGK